MSLTSGLSKLSKSSVAKKTKDTFTPNFENLSEKNFDTMLYEEIPKPPSDIRLMNGHPIINSNNIHNPPLDIRHMNGHPIINSNNIHKPPRHMNGHPIIDSNNIHNNTDYKGAIHYNDPMPMQDGNDRVARLGLLRQGDKLARQLAGSSNIKKNMEIYLQNDVYEDEYRPWWGAYDI